VPRTGAQSGFITYTSRAFHQDAMDAMRSDIVRGIIELVTNADDAYLSVDELHLGRITIEVEHRRNQQWRLIVRDRALGMRSSEMVEKIGSLAERTSGFESGLERRGNLGRGLKDLPAFGDVEFRSIREGRFSRFVLHQDGSWNLDTERDADASHREDLGIARGNGLVVTVLVNGTIRCPRHETLRRKLATHFQLRDILSDPRRRVDLVNLNDGTRERLTYEFPNLPVVFQGALAVPEYPDASAELTVWRLPDRWDDGPENDGRPNGILIKGRRAIYENTLFGLESDVHAGWFAGILVCPYIDTLAREYDDRLGRREGPVSSNPHPIISRRRDGLAPDHPFVRALRQAVEAPLRQLVAQEAEREREEAGTIESDGTRRALDRLAAELSRLIGEEMREIEAEELPVGPEGLPPVLAIVPEQVFAYMGEIRTLTVAARKENAVVGDQVAVDVDPGGVVELLTPTLSLGIHPRREDVLVGQIRLRPLIEGEVTLVTATLAERSAHALVEVKPEREIIEVEVEPPETLQFERPSYRIGWQRKKNLIIAAPPSFVAVNGPFVDVSSSDPGVVIRGSSQVELTYDDAVEFYRGSIQVEARNLNATALIVARGGEVSAETHVAVVRREEGTSLAIRLVREDWGFWRAVIENEPLEAGGEIQVIKIAGRHPAIKRYLGENFEGQDTPICRTIIAEVVADVAARLIVGELYRLRRGTELFDADRFYREHYKRMTRFLPRFQRLLVGEAATAEITPSLSPVPILEAQPS
jgi:hypothetical protein